MAISTEAQFHVLAVDDSLLDRKLIERLLRTSSYQVTTVDSGRKALELLGLQQDEQASTPSVSPYHQEMEVNLVITDYCMPGMTGFDLLKRIKETSSLKNIPVVIMSSENVPSRISRCLEEGAEEFFLKPVRMSDVKRLIPHMMKKKSEDLPKEDQMEQQQVVPPPEQQQQQSNSRGSLCTTVHTESTPQSSSSSSGNNNNNKRKAMDESPTPPERTRPRCPVTA